MTTSLKRTIIAGSFIVMFIAPYTYGGRLTYQNGAMDTDPVTLTIFVLGSLIIFGLRREIFPLEDPNHRAVGRGSRFSAAMLDMFAVMSAYFAVMFSVLLILEWLCTGTWQWSWSSHRYVVMDIVGFISICLGFWAFYQYFWIHLKTGRTTIGQYLMGFRIIELEGAQPRRRLHSGMFALWLWPVFMFAGKRSEGVYFWDHNSNTRAVSTRSV